MATATVFEVSMTMPTVALWVPKGVDTHPALVETVAFADYPGGRQVCIRGLGVSKRWVPLDEVQVLRRDERVKVVSWLAVVQFPERHG